MSLQLPPRSSKPRSRGLTAVIDFGPDDFGWTGEHGLADLLSCAGDYIDFAKIYALNALLLPEPMLKRAIGLYHDAGVETFAGGILFEYCYLRHETEELAAHLRGLGLRGLEISENYITLSEAERLRYVASFQSQGFAVIYEFGRKNPDGPLSVDRLGSVVAGMRDHGVEHVIIEQSEIDLAAQAVPEAIDRLKHEPWFDSVLIEADPYRFPQQHAGLLAVFGPEVNLANIAAGQALRLEGLRRGVGRAVDYLLIRSLEAGND